PTPPIFVNPTSLTHDYSLTHATTYNPTITIVSQFHLSQIPSLSNRSHQPTMKMPPFNSVFNKIMAVTPRKSPRLVEGTSTDEVHAPSFNILTQTPPPIIVENSDRDGSYKKEKKKESNKRKSPVNQKGNMRKGKISETHSNSDSDFISESKKKKKRKKINQCRSW
ncbi:hypothetical protein AABB24_005633, partial [Solanum stoloniferum]